MGQGCALITTTTTTTTLSQVRHQQPQWAPQDLCQLPTFRGHQHSSSRLLGLSHHSACEFPGASGWSLSETECGLEGPALVGPRRPEVDYIFLTWSQRRHSLGSNPALGRVTYATSKASCSLVGIGLAGEKKCLSLEQLPCLLWDSSDAHQLFCWCGFDAWEGAWDSAPGVATTIFPGPSPSNPNPCPCLTLHCQQLPTGGLTAVS